MNRNDDDTESNMPYQMVDDSILNIQLSQIGNIRRGSRLRGAGYDPLASSGLRKNIIEPKSMIFNSGLTGLKGKSHDPTQSSVLQGPQKPSDPYSKQPSAVDPTEEQEADFNDYNDFGQKTIQDDPDETKNQDNQGTFGKPGPKTTAEDATT